MQISHLLLIFILFKIFQLWASINWGIDKSKNNNTLSKYQYEIANSSFAILPAIYQMKVGAVTKKAYLYGGN